MSMVICAAKKFIICIVILYRAGGSNLHVVRPNLVRIGIWAVVCISMPKLGGLRACSPNKVGNFIFIPSETGF